MYGEIERIGENKYSYINPELNFSCEFDWDGESGCEVYFDVNQKLTEDVFYEDFEEYFFN